MSAASIISAVVTSGSNNHATTSYEANAYATDFVTQGIVGAVGNSGGVSTGGYGVTQDASPDMGVTILPGVAYVSGVPASQSTQVLRAYMTASYTAYTINANASGSTKFDWIYLQLNATNAGNPSAAADNVITLYTSRSTSNSADNGSPPTYGLLLAVVTVANGASSITNANIADKRVQTTLSLVSTTNTGGWTPLSLPFGTVTANGNHSYTCTFSGVDETGILSKGMRLQMTRTNAAPSNCASLNGTNQWFNNTTPAGMTFTNNFVVSAWIKLSSYPTSTGTIASRYNGTSGWYLELGSDGRVAMYGLNAGAANYSGVLSYQSVPLNKWVHITAQVDMATFTATTTTSYVMIDGVDVPAFVARGGTNPTALVQAGNLEIGGKNGGLQPLPGKIAQVAIYSAKVTQATILASMNQTLVGTETSLVSAYTLSNSLADLNANANNLTAQGSATTTNADAPFAQGATAGSLDYGIITGISFSTNTTLTVQVPEGSTIPTSGGVSSVSYSTVVIPYLFPAISKFKLSAFDTSGTVTAPLLLAMAQFVINQPLDGLQFSNSGTAGGTYYIGVNGGEKRVWGLTSTISFTASGYTTSGVTFPAGFFSTTPQFAIANLAGTASAQQLISPAAQSISTSSVTIASYSNSNSSSQISYLVIGT